MDDKPHALVVHHQEEGGEQIPGQSSDQPEFYELVSFGAGPAPEPANPRPHRYWRTRHLSAPDPQPVHRSRRHQSVSSSANLKCSIAWVKRSNKVPDRKRLWVACAHRFLWSWIAGFYSAGIGRGIGTPFRPAVTPPVRAHSPRRCPGRLISWFCSLQNEQRSDGGQRAAVEV
jgi:hypothetical protein